MTEQVEVDFDPTVISMMESVYADEIAIRIKKKVWSDSYFDNNGQRKFTIAFALGEKLEIRVAVSTVVVVVMRGINLLKGGQVSLLDPEVSHRIIDILQRLHRAIRPSDLILRRDLLRYKEEAKRWTKSVFNFEIPPEYLFQVPHRETEVTAYEYTVTMTIKDMLTKKEVTVTGHNELPELVAQRARGKLHILRELETDD